MDDDNEFSLTYTSGLSAKDAIKFYQARAASFGWSFDEDRSDIGDNAAQLHFV
ncbi:MAG: hypothetical protein GTO41_10490, partial [Burkholderiales bacterium]|nr:hypothetical protein [Burkholderiales bacterium]